MASSGVDHFLSPGERLRELRRTRGLSMRDVHTATVHIASERMNNEEFIVTPSQLNAIETLGAVPSIYKLAALAIVYDIELNQIIQWFGA